MYVSGFSERLDKAVYNKNVSYEEVVRQTGISRSCMYGYIYEQKMPSCKNLVKLANYLEVTTDYLLGRQI